MSAIDPNLADVLAALTTRDDAEAWRSASGYRAGVLPLIAARGDGAVLRPTTRQAIFSPWRHATPAEALEALVATGLLPAHWTDAMRAPRWWCDACGERGERHTTAAPPSHAALVAVASLGVAALARAEALVAETWPGRALVWRVMTAEALNAALREAYVTPTDSNRVAFWFACEAVGLWSDRWPKEFRFWSASDAPPEAVVLLDERRRLYPAMRAIAMRDTDAGPRPTGLHLVALDAGRVTLAVEALS